MDQANILKSIANGIWPEKMRIISAPSGCGKTLLLALIAWLLSIMGHKVTIASTGNGAVDNVASRLQEVKPAEIRGSGVIRVTLSSHETRMAKEGLKGDLQNKSINAVMPDPDSYAQDPIFMKLIEKSVDMDMSGESTEDGMAALHKAMDDLREDYANMQKTRGTREYDFPIQQSLAYHVQEIVDRDRTEFLNADDDEDETEGVGKGKQPAVVKPPRVNPTGEFAILQQKFRLASVREEQMEGKDVEKMLQLRLDVAHRAFQEANIIVATCDYATSPDVVEHFGGNVLLLEEAGAMGIPDAAALMAYHGKDLVVAIGDEQQLQPHNFASVVNEASNFTEVSILMMLKFKGIERFELLEQFRLRPSISLYLNQAFYNGKLRDAPESKKDHPTAVKARAVSKKLGVPLADGSETFFVHVPSGKAMTQPGDTSLQNPAFAKVSAKIALDCVKQGIDPQDIVILVFYRAQSDLIRRELNNFKDPLLDSVLIGHVGTVESYQGRERQAVIVDFTASGSQVLDDEAGDSAYVSGHVRNPHRMCVAAGRGRYLLAFVGNGKSLAETNVNGKYVYHLRLLVKTMKQRNCFCWCFMDNDGVDHDEEEEDVVVWADDGSAERIKRDEAVRQHYAFFNAIVKDRYVGKATGMNTAIAKATRDIYWFRKGGVSRQPHEEGQLAVVHGPEVQEQVVEEEPEPPAPETVAQHPRSIPALPAPLAGPWRGDSSSRAPSRSMTNWARSEAHVPRGSQPTRGSGGRAVFRVRGGIRGTFTGSGRGGPNQQGSSSEVSNQQWRGRGASNQQVRGRGAPNQQGHGPSDTAEETVSGASNQPDSAGGDTNQPAPGADATNQQGRGGPGGTIRGSTAQRGLGSNLWGRFGANLLPGGEDNQRDRGS